MRLHFNKFVTIMIMVFAMALPSMQVFATETGPSVETITLYEDYELDFDMPKDLGWKTYQDKGQWIEELGIAEDTKSLILVINNLDKEDPNAIPLAESDKAADRNRSIVEKNRMDGKSKLFYFSKGMDEEWNVVFSVECYISGGNEFEKEEIYGVYEPVMTFGSIENPGSLLPFHPLAPQDYWSTDPESETYGSIFQPENKYEKPEQAVNLLGLKSYTRYGMILQPEEDYDFCPTLVINCQQKETNNGLFSGLHMPEENLRMMIQSIDQETKMIIVDEIETLENM